MVNTLQSGDEWANAKWKQMYDVSEDMFNSIYSRLGVLFPDGVKGESAYNEMIPDVIKELETKGLVTTVDGGALGSFTGAQEAMLTNRETGEAFEMPLILQKSDSAFGYDSTDAAAIRHRAVDLRLDWIVYVTDVGQATHFALIFALAKNAGWITSSCYQGKTLEEQKALQKEFDGLTPSCLPRADHVKFGLVQDKNGQKFKTRAGKSEKLVDLLDEAVSRMATILKERVEAESTSLEMKDVDRVAAVVGYAAIKYSDLKNQRELNYRFDYDKMLDPKGDTAVYLLYSYARLSSILRKAQDMCGTSVNDVDLSAVSVYRYHVADKKFGGAPAPQDAKPTKDESIEWKLCRHLRRFDDVMHTSVSTLEPHHVCAYLYQLSVLNSQFLAQHRLLVPSQKDDSFFLDPIKGDDRLVMLECSRLVMRRCFEVLGITPLERI